MGILYGYLLTARLRLFSVILFLLSTLHILQETVQSYVQGGISSSVLSVFFTDKFPLSQSDARISVAYKICQ